MNITVFLSLSRAWRVKEMIDQVLALETKLPKRYSNEDIEIKLDLLVVIDNHEISIDDIKLPKDYPHKIIKMDGFSASEVSLGDRRAHITNVLTKAAQNIPEKTDLVFGIEDDTDFTPDSLVKLIDSYIYLSRPVKGRGVKVGVVTGVQVGRWAARMIGAWRTNNPIDPTEVRTIPFKQDGRIMEEIDAAGLYCFVSPRECFVNTPFRFGQFGPDVYYGFDLRAKEYINFIDWEVLTGHVTKHVVFRPNSEVEVVKFIKEDNFWKMVKS